MTPSARDNPSSCCVLTRVDFSQPRPLEQLVRPDAEPHDARHDCRRLDVKQLDAVGREVIDCTSQRCRCTGHEDGEQAAPSQN